MTSPNVIDHCIMMLELNKLNATGKSAVVTPPCEDLPTIVHTKDKGKKLRNYNPEAARAAGAKARRAGHNNSTRWLFDKK